MSVVDNSSNNPAYIAAINASEMQRQATEAALRGAFVRSRRAVGEHRPAARRLRSLRP